MNWKTAKTVLDYFIEKWKSETPKNFKKFYIGFHGGEPLLNMQLVRKIIRYIERNINDLNFCYAITTNGTLLLKHIDYLVEKKFLLNVSMDGDCGMNSYRVYKNGKEVYKDLYANLKKIQEEYPVFFKENIDFLSVAHSRNTNIGITSFFKSEFGKGSEIHLLSSHMVADYKKWDSMRRKTEDFNMEDRNNYYLLDFMKYFSGNSYNHYRSLLDNSRTVKTPTGTCLPFSYRVFITVRKDIIACERIGFERTLGKVTNKEVELDFERIANFYNKILDKFRIQCESCLKKESCTVCFLCNEQYFEENFVCEDFYSISDFKKCVVESLNTLRERAFKTSS